MVGVNVTLVVSKFVVAVFQIHKSKTRQPHLHFPWSVRFRRDRAPRSNARVLRSLDSPVLPHSDSASEKSRSSLSPCAPVAVLHGRVAIAAVRMGQV